MIQLDKEIFFLNKSKLIIILKTSSIREKTKVFRITNLTIKIIVFVFFTKNKACSNLNVAKIESITIRPSKKTINTKILWRVNPCKYRANRNRYSLSNTCTRH